MVRNMGRKMDVTARVNVYGADADQLATTATGIGQRLAGTGTLKGVTFENVNAVDVDEQLGVVKQWAAVAVLLVEITTDAPLQA